jgi:hypothetical protein
VYINVYIYIFPPLSLLFTGLVFLYPLDERGLLRSKERISESKEDSSDFKERSSTFSELE